MKVGLRPSSRRKCKHPILALVPLLMSSAASSIAQTPSAGTPILETVYIPPSAGVPGRVTSVSYSGPIYIQPTDSIQLRLRAPYPTNLQILINGQKLQYVAGGAPRPQPDTAGYYSFTAMAMPGFPGKVDPQTPGYNWFFWLVEIKLPWQFRSTLLQGNVSTFTLTVRDIAGMNAAPDLNLQVAPYMASPSPHSPRCSPCQSDPNSPSIVFAAGENSKSYNEGMPRATTGIAARNVTLGGWLTNDGGAMGRQDSCGGKACPPGGSEDWHFGIYLDPDFIQRNYPSADVYPFASTVLPGQPEHTACYVVDNSFGCPCLLPGCATKISLTGGRPLDVSTFLLPGGDPFLDVELNAWHTAAPPIGRGAPPAEYVPDPFANIEDPSTGNSYPGNAWAFDPRMRMVLPRMPAPGGGTLQANDYVILTGTLWEDIAHILSPDPNNPDLTAYRQCLDGIYAGQAGWLEIHPVDVVRYVWPPPPLRKHTSVLRSCVPKDQNSPNFLHWDWTGKGTHSQSPPIQTIPASPPGDHYVLHFQQIFDPRFRPTGTQVTTSLPYDPCRTNLVASEGLMSPSGDAVADSSFILTWWELSSTPRPDCPRWMSAIATPSQQLPQMVHVAVMDSQTSQPVPQAMVTVWDNYERPQASGITTADGTVSLKYSACSEFIGGGSVPCGGIVTKNGYFNVVFRTPALSATATILPADFTNPRQLKVTVKDSATQAPVQGATVTIVNEVSWSKQTGTTGTDGTVSISPYSCDPFSPCKVTVSKIGYADHVFIGPY
jgi:hypothetical protein